jgi:hypothetical protein
MSNRARPIKIALFTDALTPSPGGLHLPLYPMVTFSRITYAESARRAHRVRQPHFLDNGDHRNVDPVVQTGVIGLKN